ncbi:uncharacterized protein LOC121420484 [Lytechinus variegatus]|uniref:uncharacterized protein LOC121420484 n=1 Tax=Lytechinus variegatus TaxID=7654 RepID=UPI001BB1424F|nr:uncharacterized protein LOC121420484 [Lytechinus variegatus]XP_041471071.1 uncharacterized protein LOC121420484 [Lytechinus variegatus]
MAQKVARRSGRSESRGGRNGEIGISLGNPGEERRLAATLRKIDREKRKRETAMSWNQRNFFMKQVFDQDNDLRFVKAAQRPKYLNCIPPPPRDGDNSWLKEEYVFSFKPKSSTSPESKDFKQGTSDEKSLDESLKTMGLEDETSSADQVPQGDESKTDVQETTMTASKESEQAERDRKEEEKRDLASRGVFGSRREKVKMPPLMSGAWKQKLESEMKVEEVVEEDKGEECKITSNLELEVQKSDVEDADPLNNAKPNPGGAETVKPKTRFPVLKVRALGLFAMTFKKTPAVPSLASQLPVESPSTNDLKLSPISSPEKDASVLTASLPPQAAPHVKVKGKSPPPTVPALSEMHRPASVSLPNSPVTDRKPQLIRQQSDHSVLVSAPTRDKLITAIQASEKGHSRSRRGSRRDSAANPNQERSKRHRHENGIKPVKSASSTLPKKTRESTAKTHSSSSLPKTDNHDSSHIWGVSGENETQEKDNKDNARKNCDVNDEEEVDYHVIRRIVRTLPAHLMLKTSKREVEAGGDVALLRQKMKDLARAEATKRASLDPRFKQLEKSLINSPNDNMK